MKSVRVSELMEFLAKRTRPSDRPRSYSEDEVIGLVEIAELESTDSNELNEKVDVFKKRYNKY